MIKKLFLSVMVLGGSGNSFAQEVVEEEKGKLSVSGYVETYYQHDFNRSLQNSRPGFVYSHNRNNEVNLNLALVKLNYTNQKVRANLALATGTYMNANYAAEPGVLKNIYEANVGVKLSKKHELWLDAGVMPSHIGFESAVGKDNWTLTRSLMADNSPYFETGARLSYSSQNGKWFASGLVLNGWQRIQRPAGTTLPAFGHQLTYKAGTRFTINSSSFIGNEKVDSLRQMRYFHNLYAIWQMNERLGITAGFDIGAEQKAKGSSSYNTWYAPTAIVRYAPVRFLSVAVRGEYYRDQNSVIITTDTKQCFQTFGYSMNIDYQILSNVCWRTEVKNLNNRDLLFETRTASLSKNSTTITTALTLSF